MSAMGGSLPREIAELPFDLGVHVERFLAASDAACVTRLDEGSDLLEDLGIGRRGRPRELAQLRLDVDRLLAARLPSRVARLEHLADVVLALGPGRRRGRRLVADRQPAAP